MPLDLSPELLARALSASSQPPALSAPAPETSPPQMGMGKGAMWTMLGGQGADALSTILALQDPNLRETNPMDAKGALIAKAVMLSLMPLLTKKMPRGMANVIGYGAGAVGGAAAANNVLQMKKAP